MFLQCYLTLVNFSNVSGGVKLPADCFLVPADVSSLYPSIDTKMVIIALDLLLKEGMVAQTALLLQFTRLVRELFPTIRF